jgi:hypothetical protein
MTQDEGASSVKAQVRHANSSRFSDLSSRGKRRFELLASARFFERGRATHHSEQKRNRMGSFLVGPPVSAAGEDMVTGRRRDFDSATAVELRIHVVRHVCIGRERQRRRR